MSEYVKTTWTNGSGQSINDINLNKIEQGIEDAFENTKINLMIIALGGIV